LLQRNQFQRLVRTCVGDGDTQEKSGWLAEPNQFQPIQAVSNSAQDREDHPFESQNNTRLHNQIKRGTYDKKLFSRKKAWWISAVAQPPNLSKDMGREAGGSHDQHGSVLFQ
jgi:hypothetical protein